MLILSHTYKPMVNILQNFTNIKSPHRLQNFQTNGINFFSLLIPPSTESPKAEESSEYLHFHMCHQNMVVFVKMMQEAASHEVKGLIFSQNIVSVFCTPSYIKKKKKKDENSWTHSFFQPNVITMSPC